MTLLSRRGAVPPVSSADVRRMQRRRDEFVLGFAVVLVTLAFVVAVGAAGLLAVYSALR
jgi:hypothetical protein